jgi:5'-3' exonuclease
MQRVDLLAIDGKNLLWRCSDSHRELSAPVDGTRIATGGIYGFLSSVVRIHARYGGRVVIAWEGKQNFRKRLFPPYKLRGELTPEQAELIKEMSEQQERLIEILSALGVEQYRGKWCEADDVLGRLARLENEAGRSVAIYSGDSDMRQLVRSGVIVVSPEFRQDHVYGEKTVFERYGIPPRLLAQLKALAGDPSDRIPGAPGIGMKTATKLLQHYGSLLHVLSAASTAAPDWPDTVRRRKIIAAHEDQIMLFWKLTTIRDHMPWIHRRAERSQRRVIELFRRYRFRSLEVPSELRSLMKLGGSVETAAGTRCA